MTGEDSYRLYSLLSEWLCPKSCFYCQLYESPNRAKTYKKETGFRVNWNQLLQEEFLSLQTKKNLGQAVKTEPKARF